MSIDPKSTYYDAGGIETMEVLKAKLTPEQFQGYLLGTAMVYLLRANWKENFNRDIEKAGVYLGIMNRKEEVSKTEPVFKPGFPIEPLEKCGKCGEIISQFSVCPICKE